MVTARQSAKVAGVALAVFVILVGGWFAYWKIAKAGQSARYDVNTHSQQYQANLIAQERDLVTGYHAARNDDQRQAIADQFCAVYPELDPPTPDLVREAARICAPPD